MSEARKMKQPRAERPRAIAAKPRRSVQQVPSGIETPSQIVAVACLPEADLNDRSLGACPNTWWP